MRVARAFALSLVPFLLDCCETEVEGRFCGVLPNGVGCVKFKLRYVDCDGKADQVCNEGSKGMCVQPKDGDGKPIGDPIEVPPGKCVDMPPGTEEATKVDCLEDDDEEGSPWFPGRPPTVVPTYYATTYSLEPGISTVEYAVQAPNEQHVFDLIQLHEDGHPAPRVDVLAETTLAHSEAEILITLRLPTEDLQEFSVYLDGVLVASSADGLGDPTIEEDEEGYRIASVAVVYLPTPAGGLLDILNVDENGEEWSRTFQYVEI